MRPGHLAIALLLAVTCIACGVTTGDGSSITERAAAVSGYVHAGPTCPVVQDPPEAGCEDRAVADGLLLILDATGAEVAAARTADDGTFEVTLPPGSYVLVPQPVEGLLGTAPRQNLEVADQPVTGLDIAYDTGIR
jgi:hypothetical protein